MHTVKISIAAIVLIILIITFGLFTNYSLSASSKDIENYVVNIEGNIKNDNWVMADRELTNMEKEWSKIGKVWSLLIDHVEIDNIDNAVSRLSTFIESKDTSQTLAEAATLKQYVTHIPEKESFKIKNIL